MPERRRRDSEQRGRSSDSPIVRHTTLWSGPRKLAGELRGGVSALTMHIRALLIEIDPDIDADAIAPMLLSAVAPPALAQIRHAGADTERACAAARRLLDGLG